MAEAVSRTGDDDGVLTHFETRMRDDPEAGGREFEGLLNELEKTDPARAERLDLRMRERAGPTGSRFFPQPIPPTARPGPVPSARPGMRDILQPPGDTAATMRPAPDLHPTVTLEFDGTEFRAVENGRVVKVWPAVSGGSGIQGSEQDKAPRPRANGC